MPIVFYLALSLCYFSSMEVKINAEIINVPESWNELSSQQAIDIAKAVFGAGDATFNRIKINILMILLDKDKAFFEFWEKDAGPDYLAELEEMLSLADCFFDEIIIEGHIPFVAPAKTLTKNPLPKLGIGYSYLYGPSDTLSDLTFDEWILMEHYLSKNTPESISNCIAVLYRPGMKKWSIIPTSERSPLVDKNVEKRGKIIAKHVPYYLQQLILLYIASSKAAIAKKFEYLFDGKGKGSHWINIKLAISQQTVFGAFKDVGKTKVLVILLHLTNLKKAEEQLEMERLQRKMSA